MRKNAVIFGYSGHAYVVLDILKINQYNVKGYFDEEEKKINPFDIPYLGSDKETEELFRNGNLEAFLGVGDNKVRSSIFKELTNKLISLPIAIHPKSYISDLANIGSGTVVMAGTVINALAQIGTAVICNTSCVIEHECIIGDNVHIAPGAVLAGNVVVGSNTFIGANSVIRQGVKIGSNVIVGAGSVLTKNIADNVIVYGNPAKNRIWVK